MIPYIEEFAQRSSFAMTNKNRKKPLIIALIVLGALAVIALGIWFFWLKDYLAAANASPVYVNPISSIVGLNMDSNPRYSGLVEPQETYKINKDESKTVAEVFVQEGDEVHVGDVLFRYDTEEMQFALDQAELDLEGIANLITTYNSQLKTLNDEKKKASKDEQYSYTVQIQSVQFDIKNQENESSKKKAEIEKLRESLTNADVYSEYDGVVKEVNNGNNQQDFSSQSSAFISILSSGEFRIKGSISELNFNSIAVGMPVIVHSRVDPEMTWTGMVDSIDQENSNDNNNNGYFYYGYDSGDKSSKYNFYVTLDSPDGLILGQHVYIEPDSGESSQKSGLWLPAMYIDHLDDSGSFVWAQNEKEKLEKRFVTLGDYDSETDTYEIKSGLTRSDLIAYPNEKLMPGMPTTTDASYQDVSDGSDPGYTGGDMDIPQAPEGGDMPAEDSYDPEDNTIPENDFVIPADEGGIIE